MFDAVVRSLNDAVDGVVDVADCGCGGAQYVDIDDVADGLMSASKSRQLLKHRHHRLSLDAAAYVQRVEEVFADVGSEASLQQCVNEHVGQH